MALVMPKHTNEIVQYIAIDSLDLYYYYSITDFSSKPHMLMT